MLIDSVYRKDESYYPKVFFKKNMILSDDSNDSNDSNGKVSTEKI